MQKPRQFSEKINAEKTLIQKSGYFARSSAPCQQDLDLIFKSADFAVKSALNEVSGVVGMDEDFNNEIRCIEFHRIKGGKSFDCKVDWFQNLLTDIGQPI